MRSERERESETRRTTERERVTTVQEPFFPPIVVYLFAVNCCSAESIENVMFYLINAYALTIEL